MQVEGYNTGRDSLGHRIWHIWMGTTVLVAVLAVTDQPVIVDWFGKNQ